MLNLGCGAVYHPAWINLDVVPATPAVKRFDVRRPLPFADATVDVVYHSHMLEHLVATDARRLLCECQRVLRPGGILRVAVPDLEGIARAYLDELAVVREGGDATRYGWCRLELIDQAARDVSGGAMLDYLRTLPPEKLEHVRTRAGAEVDSILQSSRNRSRQITLGKMWRRGRRELARVMVHVLGGRAMKAAFDEGLFRQSGEVHRVMYDEVSLGRLLSECGFGSPRVVAATESQIPGYADYGLDVVDGTVRKPDSLFMEAVRP